MEKPSTGLAESQPSEWSRDVGVRDSGTSTGVVEGILEEKLEEALGAERSERSAECRAYRNGTKPRRLTFALGERGLAGAVGSAGERRRRGGRMAQSVGAALSALDAGRLRLDNQRPHSVRLIRIVDGSVAAAPTIYRGTSSSDGGGLETSEPAANVSANGVPSFPLARSLATQLLLKVARLTTPTCGPEAAPRD